MNGNMMTLDAMSNRAVANAAINPIFGRTSPWDYADFDEEEARSSVLRIACGYADIGDITMLAPPMRVAYEAAASVSNDVDDIVNVMKCIYPKLGGLSQKFVGIRVDAENLTASAEAVVVKLDRDSYTVCRYSDTRTRVRVTVSACLQAIASRKPCRFNGADRRDFLRLIKTRRDYDNIVNRLNGLLEARGWGMFDLAYAQSLQDFCGKIMFEAFRNAVLSANGGQWPNLPPYTADIDDVIRIAKKFLAMSDGATKDEVAEASCLRRCRF